MEEGEGGVRGFITGFYLYDLNDDNIPELFIQKNRIADYIYTYVDGNVEMRNRIIYDAFGESYFGFDPESGDAYSFTLDVGTGTDRSTELSKLSLINNTDDTYDGGELIYSALYGDIEKADGTYDSIKWEDAIPSENNQITAVEFYKIAERFVPFDFHQIADENIEKYIVSNYMDIVEAYSVEAYAEKMNELSREYDDKVHSGPIKDGKIAAPDNAIMVEDFIGNVYCDVDSLECYRESEMAPEFDEAWKNIYWMWVKDKEKFDGSSELWEDKNNSRFGFIDWTGHEMPILYIDAGSNSSLYYLYVIIDNKVVQIASGMAAMGADTTALINNTEYYIVHSSYSGSYYESIHAGLYCIKESGVEDIWSIDWVYEFEDEWGGDNYESPWNTSYENYDCTFLGQQLSAYEGLAKIDELLGDGAGEQIMAYVNYTDDKNNGPLSFTDEYRDNNTWTWDEWIYALDSY